MKGQWIGSYKGTTKGTIVVDIDEFDSHYGGVAYLIEDTDSLPNVAISFKTADKKPSFKINSDDIWAFDKQGVVTSWEAIQNRFPNVNFSKSAKIEGRVESDILSISWKTNLGILGSCDLPRSQAQSPSDLEAEKCSWSAYKESVAKNETNRILYRGQENPWRLRSPFYRRGRYNLQRFLEDDIPTLKRAISARTKHVFNLNNPDENGAFIGLIQHHGYPTPMLDWTYSPYIAAFFAFRHVSKALSINEPGRHVRIFAFDSEKWVKSNSPILMIAPPYRHVTISSFLPIENERIIPQQGVSMVTNVDDIEGFILRKPSNEDKYLLAFDIPYSERKIVMRELSFMGISAGSLFPGHDGSCEELAERNFEL